MIHPIPPGLFCVPAALVAITGADLESVIVPALNRHSGRKSLSDTIVAEHMYVATAVLEELGYRVRHYKSTAASGPLRSRISTWAERSTKWPGRAVLVATSKHCLVISNGKVYDNWSPLGEPGNTHPFAKTTVTWAALVEPK